jgi:hypothetical protein
MRRYIPFAIAPFAFALLAAGPASADEEGDGGRIVGLHINTPGSDQHALFQGKITIRNTRGKRDEYVWGGSSCPGQKLNESQVQLLAAALRGRTTIQPFYDPADSGGQRCLVGFELRA